jgi:hypothetical protein
VNHEGMYVLSAQSNIETCDYVYITRDNLNYVKKPIAQASSKKDAMMNRLKSQKIEYPFLILQPENISSCEIINAEYIACNKYYIKNADIYTGVRELIPISFTTILEKTVEYFKIFSEDNYKEQKLYLHHLLKVRYQSLLMQYSADEDEKAYIEELLQEISVMVNAKAREVK